MSGLLTTQHLVDEFTEKVVERLDSERLDGPLRLDNTHTVAIIPVKNRGTIHAHLRRGIGDEGVSDLLQQIEGVPSLKGLVKHAD